MSRLDGYIAEQFHIEVEQLSRAVIEQEQLKRLNELLAWCKKNSAYYADYPEKLESLDEIRTLPFLTAQMLAEHYPQLVCVSQSEISRVVTMQTSGTSGMQKRLFFSDADQQLTIDFFACGLSELNEPGDRCMILMPGHHPGGMSYLIGKALEKIGTIPVPCGHDKTFSEMAKLLNEQQVTTMVGSPVQILSLARYLKHFQLPHTIKAVLVSSDYLPETVRHAIEDTLHCSVYDHYGITEAGLGFSIECECHDGLHMRENDLLVEIIDPETGEILPDGEWGEMVFTTLTRRAMPLIRYRTGDKARILKEPCVCGSIVKRMDKISGRIQQLKEPYCMPVLDEILFQLPQIVDYQAVYREHSGQLQISAILCNTEPSAEETVRAVLQPLLKEEHTLTVSFEYLSEENRDTVKSLYAAKRKVITGE
ncbi:MAG: phenylacetate--CoA ligase family protein [Peptococcaceae bacterium]|nr:phenylacetate--CoA ligase family protein [Peptococcaceae bacterium]